MKIKLAYTIGMIIIANPIYAKIPSHVGDLVARDLSGAGPAGHVGIATGDFFNSRPYLVLEAMDSVPHIQQNTIQDFKSRTKYWGSKGGLLPPPSQSNESFYVANRIVRQYFACPEYSYTWRWKEGQIDDNTRPISCALFRCDTLVNYAYAFSPSYSLPTYDTKWTNPLAIYNYFPVESDLFLPEHHNVYSVSLSVGSDNFDSINENNLKELNAEVFYQMLQNSKEISKEQIIHLWKLFTSNEVNEKVKILFYDFISFDAPDYLTAEIIKQAKKEKGKLRHKLLVNLQFIYQKNNDSKNLKEIVEYFKELQFENLNKDDGGIVYRGLATLTHNHFETNNLTLTNMDKIHVSLFNLKNDQSNEIKYIKDIIYNLEHPDDTLVVTAGYKYLTELLIKSNLNFLSNKSKQLFLKHLEKSSMVKMNQSILYIPAYLEFKAVLTASKIEDIPTLINDYIQLLKPEVQEAISPGFTILIK